MLTNANCKITRITVSDAQVEMMLLSIIQVTASHSLPQLCFNEIPLFKTKINKY